MTSTGNEIGLFGDELAALAPALKPGRRQRHRVVRTSRTESRAEISYTDRRMVYARDHFRCVWCGSGNDLTLDHIVPWSAGGGDNVENLRTLCWPCNGYRSNFKHEADERATRTLPLAFWCADCPDEDDGDGLPLHHPGIQPVFCWWCRMPSTGIPGRWFRENNAFWDYAIQWHREGTRDQWEAVNA